MSQVSLGTAEGRTASRPARQIFRFENHDEALTVWRKAGCADRILVHVDAHHDMWWVDPGQPVTIANFISPALRDGLLRELYWVVPDRSWDSAENRRQILHHVDRIKRQFPGRPAPTQIHRDRITTTLLGKPLQICSIEGLPKFQEEVLLDLDVDFLIFPRVTYGNGDPHPPLPWMWPEELLSRLDAGELKSDLVTIADSVYGGYTPLCWKYLGDELEVCLNGGDASLLRGMKFMRCGAEAAARGEYTRAEQEYSQAAECLPNFAAPLWRLAFCYLDLGRMTEARQAYQRALEMDPGYRTPFNNDALWYFWDRRWDAAASECRRTLELDPQDTFAHLGLGWIAIEHKNWTAAETELRLVLEIRPRMLDAHRALGIVLQATGRQREAIPEFERSLKLALGGQESLQECPKIAVERPRLNDRRHFEVFGQLAKAHFAIGQWDQAAQCLNMAAADQLDNVALRCRLASMAVRQRQWKSAGRHFALALKQLAVQTGYASRKLRRGMRRPFRRAFEWWRVR